MTKSRRSFLFGAASCAALGTSLFRSKVAWANSGFEYDALGRLIKATLADGTIVYYRYDAAGNRTQVESAGGGGEPPPPPPPPPPFSATIDVAGSPPINLRNLANAAGYTGAQPATITFFVAANTILVGQPGAPDGGHAIDTGDWPTGIHALALTLRVAGKLYGGGGKGGNGALASGTDYAEPGQAGGRGGDALFCRTNISVVVEATGEVRGGGGAGGGGAQATGIGLVNRRYNLAGGGGGGGFPNGSGGQTSAPLQPGSPGTTSGGGIGSAGFSVSNGRSQGSTVSSAGRGGQGGATGQAGAAGTVGSNGSGPGAGGALGYAIRKNGRSVSVTNNGTITGPQG